VKDVQNGTPAAKAGLKSGDVIVKFDGEGVRGTAHLRRLVEETPAGRPVSIEVTRGSAKETLTATLEGGKGRSVDIEGDAPWAGFPPPRMPEPPEAPEPPELPGFHWHGHRGDVGGPRKLGIRFQEISGQLALYFRLPSDQGILVVHVDSDSPASKAGIKAGDVLLKVDGKSVSDENDLRRAVDGLEPGKDASVTVQRDGKPVDLKVTVGGKKQEKRETT
jgi:S1-C subfamily serine protease